MKKGEAKKTAKEKQRETLKNYFIRWKIGIFYENKQKKGTQKKGEKQIRRF